MKVVLEGVRAAIEPCSLALIVPGLATTLLAVPRGPLAAVAFAVTAWLAAWGQATVLLQVGSGPLVGVVLAGVAGLGTWGLWRSDTWAAPGAMGIGLAAGLLWQPCVGPQLGAILTRAADKPLEVLLPMGLYMLGLLALLGVAAAVPAVDDRITSGLSTVPVQVAATVPLAVLVAVLATGQYEQIIGALVRASSLT